MGTGTGLRAYQAKVLAKLRQGMSRAPGETFTVMFPRQAGKNEVSAFLVAGLLMEHARRGGAVVVCAPTLHPQAAISLDRTRHFMTRIERALKGKGARIKDGRTIELGRASAVFLSGSPEAHVAGHTASIAIIADEAQELDADWFNRQFRPMAASTGAPTIMFGTAWDGRTLLEQAAARNREIDARRGPDATVQLHHEAGWREVANSRPAYGRYVERERARLGAGHPLYLSQYELAAAEDAGRLFTNAQAKALQGRHPRLHGPQPGERYVGGLDLGGDGDGADATVLTIARVAGDRTEVVQHLRWQGAAYAEMESAALTAARAWQLERLCVDGTGMGAPIAARLESELGGRVVERAVFSSQSKSEMGYALIAAANTGRLLLYAGDGAPDLVRCVTELRECRSGYRVNRQVWWEAPAGKHDDYVASLALCLRAAETLGPSRVARGRLRE